METAAGCQSGVSRRTNGTKKLPHACRNTKTKTTLSAGRMSGTTTVRSARMALAPSTHAASSRLTGTESMKFFVIHSAIGSALAARNRATAHG